MNGDAPAGIRVLLVDDEVAYANVLAKRMHLRGLSATPTYSGREALTALRKQDYDVAILDLKMEEMDGIELLKIIRKVVPEMRVIILTGHGGEKEAREAVLEGAFDYLLKPCELDAIIEAIHRAVSHSGQAKDVTGVS